MNPQDKIEIGHSLYSIVAAGIFLFAAVLHGLRAYYEWVLIIHTWTVPIWVSWLVALVAFLMSITALRKMR